MLTLRLVGTEEAVEAATTLHDALWAFRERLTKTDTPPAYKSREYLRIYHPVRVARDAFIEVANSELKTHP